MSSGKGASAGGPSEWWAQEGSRRGGGVVGPRAGLQERAVTSLWLGPRDPRKAVERGSEPGWVQCSHCKRVVVQTVRNRSHLSRGVTPHSC